MGVKERMKENKSYFVQPILKGGGAWDLLSRIGKEAVGYGTQNGRTGRLAAFGDVNNGYPQNTRVSAPSNPKMGRLALTCDSRQQT